MAFGNYYGAYPQQNYYAQLQMQTPQMPQQSAPMNNSGLIWVQGETGAKSYLVAPNTTVMLMDSEGSRFFLKSTDASGMPLPLRIFDYKEVNSAQGDKTPILTHEDDSGEFVRRDEFDALMKRVDALTAKKSEKKTKEVTTDE